MIVVGVDDSPGARAALVWAARHAAATRSSLRVVYAYEFNIAWVDQYNPAIPEWVEHARQVAQDTAQRIVADALGSPTPDGVEVTAVEGKPVDVLHEESRHADLLVVGTRGRGGFAGLLLGSVSQRAVQHSSCPVVVVPPPRDSGG